MSISRLVRLFMIVLYLLKPVSIIHYWTHVSLNFDYSATVYVLHIYRYIFFIWIHYFEFFTYFCLTWYSIFCCSRCWIIIYHILDLRCSLFSHCNIVYHMSYKFYFVISYDIRYISMTHMYISTYMLVCEHDIFINILKIFFNLLHISHLIILHKCIVYKVFK